MHIHLWEWYREYIRHGNKRYSIWKPRLPKATRCIVYRHRIEKWCFLGVPITIRLLYQFHFLKSIFIVEAGRATNSTSTIRKTEYDSQCGQWTLMPKTAPLWSTTFYSYHSSKRLRPSSQIYVVCKHRIFMNNCTYSSSDYKWKNVFDC